MAGVCIDLTTEMRFKPLRRGEQDGQISLKARVGRRLCAAPGEAFMQLAADEGFFAAGKTRKTGMCA